MRFAEFEGEWETQRLGEIAKFSKGKGISKSDIHENGKNNCIRYGELYTHYGEVIIDTRSKTNVDPVNLIFSEANDVIIPSSGETQIDIATASCVIKSGIALGGDLNIIKTPNNGVFLSYYLNSKKKIKIANLAQGVSVVHLYSKQLASLKINFPSLVEQNKVAHFITLIDQRISTQNEIIEKYESLMKSLLRSVFLKELRFKNEYGDEISKWVFSKMKDVFKRSTLKNFDKKQKRVLTNSASRGIISQNDYFDKNIANQNNLQEYYVVDIDDFVYNPRISLAAPVGPLKRNKLAKGVMSPLYTVLKPLKGNLEYLEYYFETSRWHRYMRAIANYGARHDRMNITISDFENLPIPFPLPIEQNKIANFLNSVSEKLNAEKKLLEQFQHQKKYFLQNLFI